MNSDQMVSKLGILLNRKNPESNYNYAERLMMLNEGQLYVAGELPINVVRQIETVSSALAVDSSGGISLAALTRLTVVEESSPSTTVFKGTAGEGLSTTNDAYNGAVIVNLTNGTRHIVTDYVGSTRQFTVTAEVSASPRTWDSGDEYYFPNNELALPVPLNGDRGIQSVLHSSGYYCNPMDQDEQHYATEYSYSYPSNDPRYFIRGEAIYLNPYTYNTTTGVITYKRVPAEITDSVACVFADDVQNLIVDYALALGLKIDEKFALSGSLMRLVADRIREMTNRFVLPRNLVMEVGMMTESRNNYRDGDIKTFSSRS